MSTTTRFDIRVIHQPSQTMVAVHRNASRHTMADYLDRFPADDGFDVMLDTVTITTSTTSDTLTPCPNDHAHTRHWCGHVQCRDS